jgi:predicted RNase H-like nuclease (RuvC/YqgF family)
MSPTICPTCQEWQRIAFKGTGQMTPAGLEGALMASVPGYKLDKALEDLKAAKESAENLLRLRDTDSANTRRLEDENTVLGARAVELQEQNTRLLVTNSENERAIQSMTDRLAAMDQALAAARGTTE